ncbi:hypothetical protein [Bradyrhizobium sp. Cp5.3]|uniref:hypothetical protein n=1 Tax=Bradyrhizobium sp. Cp5.3 TaxID=443598 RepID=UPI0004164F7A|nr:hypothetical protein [Bradyrhizobium sp. Cp5.3]
MNSIGIQALLMPLAGLHLVLTHHELMEMIEFVRAFGSSYRLAASEPGASLFYGRFTFNFCRVVVACVRDSRSMKVCCSVAAWQHSNA